MVTLVWLRHAESEANRLRLYCGHHDTPLSERGRLQAKQAAHSLQPYNLAAIYSSDLSRAVDTAREVAQFHPQIPLYLCSDLREISFGRWEMRTYEQIAAEDEQRIRAFYDDPWSTSPPDGESLREVSKRLARFLDHVLMAHRGKSILIVSHGGIINLFRSQYVHPGTPFFSLRQPAHAATLTYTYRYMTGEWQDDSTYPFAPGD